jgi:exopolysaccharide production protein ExoQ
MPKAAMPRFEEMARPKSSVRMLDKFALIPVLACLYVEIVGPLLMYLTSGPRDESSSAAEKLQAMMAPRLENKIFWPTLAAIAVALALRNWSKLSFPPHIKFLFAYLGLAGVSLLWAFRPELSATRFVLEAMVITSIVLPWLLAVQTADMMRGVFLCFALALILNVYFVLNQTPIIIDHVIIGYPGYFSFKGILGECAAIGLLFSLHEMLFPGWRRVLGFIVIVIAIYLLVASQSKGSLGLGLIAPVLAGLTLFIAKKMRVSPAMVLLPIPVSYFFLSTVVGNLVNRISWHIYGNYTLSGRTLIWDFANSEIARSPVLGWGYQSFWLVGPDAPSVVDASGWIKAMPSAHNGYLDTTLDLGYVGLALLVIFIFTTLHAIGRVTNREPRRAWLLLTLALYVILTNFLETIWMHGTDMLWLIFVIVAAETGRYWQSSPLVSPEPPRHPIIAGRRVGLGRVRGSNKAARFQSGRT